MRWVALGQMGQSQGDGVVRCARESSRGITFRWTEAEKCRCPVERDQGP